jgi:FMN phosphatase YigB (HAD superfamily)
MQEVANILFDFGNVIIDIDVPGTTQALLDIKSEGLDAEEYHTRIKELVFLYEVDAITTDDFLRSMQKLARSGTSLDDIIELWNGMLVSIPAYRLGMLEQLRKNFNVFMLSNTNYLHIAWVHDHVRDMHGVSNFEEDFLHGAYYSHLIKKRKPTPEAFAHVLEDAYITPGRTLFIDDMEQNIAAANKLGFQTLHSPPEDEVAETLKVMGMY